MNPPLYLRIAFICYRIKTRRQATRLWNWIDSQEDPDPLWEIMLYLCPKFFDDERDANSIQFEY